MLVCLGSILAADSQGTDHRVAAMQQSVTQLLKRTNWDDPRLTKTYASFLASMPGEFLKQFGSSVHKAHKSREMNPLLLQTMQQLNSEKGQAIIDGLGSDPRITFIDSQREDAHAGCCDTPDPAKDRKAYRTDLAINASQTLADGGLAWKTDSKLAEANAIHEGLDTSGSFSSILPSLAPWITKRWPSIHAKTKKIFANPRTDAFIGFSQGATLAGGLWGTFLFSDTMPSVLMAGLRATLCVSAFTLATNIWRKKALSKAATSHNKRGSMLHAWFDIGGSLATPVPYIAAFFSSASNAAVVEQGLSGAMAVAGTYFGYKFMRPALATLRRSRPPKIKRSDSKKVAFLIRRYLADSDTNVEAKVSKVRLSVESINEAKIHVGLPASFFTLPEKERENICLDILVLLSKNFPLKQQLSLSVSAKDDNVAYLYDYSPPHQHDHSHHHEEVTSCSLSHEGGDHYDEAHEGCSQHNPPKGRETCSSGFNRAPHKDVKSISPSRLQEVRHAFVVRSVNEQPISEKQVAGIKEALREGYIWEADSNSVVFKSPLGNSPTRFSNRNRHETISDLEVRALVESQVSGLGFGSSGSTTGEVPFSKKSPAARVVDQQDVGRPFSPPISEKPAQPKTLASV